MQLIINFDIKTIRFNELYFNIHLEGIFCHVYDYWSDACINYYDIIGHQL